jgi:hypothetical protein
MSHVDSAYRRKLAVCCLLSALAVSPVAAQTVAASPSAPAGGAAAEAYGEIVYAEGREFAVVHEGASRTYRPATDDVIGLRLSVGDLVQTAGYSFVEIQLIPQGSVLKLAENSSFYIQGLGAGGDSISLGLVYGRVRAKVASLTGAARFAIRSGATVAGVRGTDFGIDAVIAQPSKAGGNVSQPAVQVYCFEGSVSVAPQAAVEDEFAEAAAQVAVAADQLLSVDLSSAVPLIERREIDASVNDYWRTNEFKGETPIPAPPSAPLPAAEPAAAAAAETAVVSELVQATAATAASEPAVQAGPAPAAVDLAPYKAAFDARSGFVNVAAFLSGTGAALGLIGYVAPIFGYGAVGQQLVLAGGVSAGLSLVSLLCSYFIQWPK